MPTRAWWSTLLMAWACTIVGGGLGGAAAFATGYPIAGAFGLVAGLYVGVILGWIVAAPVTIAVQVAVRRGRDAAALAKDLRRTGTALGVVTCAPWSAAMWGGTGTHSPTARVVGFAIGVPVAIVLTGCIGRWTGATFARWRFGPATDDADGGAPTGVPEIVRHQSEVQA